MPRLPIFARSIRQGHHQQLRREPPRRRQPLPSNIDEAKHSPSHPGQTTLAGQRAQDGAHVRSPHLDAARVRVTCFSIDKPRRAAFGRCSAGAYRAGALRGRSPANQGWRRVFRDLGHGPPRDAVGGQVLNLRTPASPAKVHVGHGPGARQRSRAQLFQGLGSPTGLSYILRIIYIM